MAMPYAARDCQVNGQKIGRTKQKNAKNDLTHKVQDCIIKKEKDIHESLATADIFIRISNSRLLYQRKNN
jgi:hypothetical protein